MSNKNEDNLTISIEAMLPEITKTVAAELRVRALNSLQYDVQSAVSAEVKTYIAENIVPAVRKELAKHDAELRAVFVDAVRGAMELTAKAVLTATAKRLASYEGDKIVQTILRDIVGDR